MTDTDIQFLLAMWALLSVFLLAGALMYFCAIAWNTWKNFDRGYGLVESFCMAKEELK